MENNIVLSVGDVVDGITLLVSLITLSCLGIYFFITFEKLKWWNWAIIFVLGSGCIPMITTIVKLINLLV